MLIRFQSCFAPDAVVNDMGREIRGIAMAGESNGYRAALARRLLTPGLISSLPGTAGSPPFISFDKLP